jgi:hypothetical protein
MSFQQPRLLEGLLTDIALINDLRINWLLNFWSLSLWWSSLALGWGLRGKIIHWLIINVFSAVQEMITIINHIEKVFIKFNQGRSSIDVFS